MSILVTKTHQVIVCNYIHMYNEKLCTQPDLIHIKKYYISSM